MPATHGLQRKAAHHAHRFGVADAPCDRSRRRADWMTLAQRGDTIAYRALLDDVGPLVTRFLRRRVRDAEDLADACQDAFLALHRARFTYQSPRPVEPWLFAIARNVAADYARGWRRRRRLECSMDMSTSSTSESPQGDVASRLVTVIRSLPKRQSEALQLLKLQGLSIREAAARVGTTPAALKLRAHRAYVTLRAAFRA